MGGCTHDQATDTGQKPTVTKNLRPKLQHWIQGMEEEVPYHETHTQQLNKSVPWLNPSCTFFRTAHLDAQYDGQLATNASTTYSETSTDGVYAQT